MKINDVIYLDFQASTPLDPRALTAMKPFFEESAGNPHSADHVLGWQAASAVEGALGDVAAMIGAFPEEIVFTSGATEANNHAILGAAIAARNGSRKRIIISAAEHKCVLAAAEAAAELFEFKVEYAPIDQFGRVNLDWLNDNIDERVLLVSAIAVNNEIGVIQDLQSISTLTRSVGALFHSDCAQAPVAMDMGNIAQIADMASFSAHKLYGPNGVGALYIERSIQDRIKPIIHGGGQQNSARSGTVPTPLVAGMGAACQLVRDDVGEAERLHVRSLRDHFFNLLRSAKIECELVTPVMSGAHPGNANVRFNGLNAHDILQSVQPKLAASTGSACSSGLPAPSHVLRAIGLSEQAAEECIRFSIGRGTTERDVEEAVDILMAAVHSLDQRNNAVVG